jgi:hypothetical protein
VEFCGSLWSFVEFCGVPGSFVEFCGVLWSFSTVSELSLEESFMILYIS